MDVTLRDAYAAFANTPERADFLGNVAEAAAHRATNGELAKPATIARVLGRAAADGHLILSFVRPNEQALAEQLDVGGDVPAVKSDSLLVTTQNSGGNKLDYYLRRRLDYTVRLQPFSSGDRATVAGRLEMRLENTAPASGPPRYVIGPPGGTQDPFIVGAAGGSKDLIAGQNRAFFSLYTPFDVRRLTLDGQRVRGEAATELGRRVYSAYVSVFANSSRTVNADLEGEVALKHGGWYELNLLRQPHLTADDVNVRIEVPRGWRIAEVGGRLHRTNPRRAARHFELTTPTSLRVRVVPDADGRNLWQRLEAGT